VRRIPVPLRSHNARGRRGRAKKSLKDWGAFSPPTPPYYTPSFLPAPALTRPARSRRERSRLSPVLPEALLPLGQEDTDKPKTAAVVPIRRPIVAPVG
jgi:hypothetical protein